jgi:hypothetical protein
MRRLLLAAAFAAVTAGLPMARPVLAAPLGAYDSHHQWHDANWWFRNQPNWVGSHHPDWVQAHPEWRRAGDWDEQHQWHTKTWYVHNRHDWAAHNHPDWH